MKFTHLSILVFLFIINSPNVIGCSFDTDCEVGSKCVKQRGNIYGWCVGGLNPGNQNDRRPARDPLDLTGKKGNTCSFDLDCGIGGKCVKGGGIYGTCL